MRIHDLGELSGEVMLFGGIYSNLQALQALLAIARARNIPPSNMLCSGDVVAYCADAQACTREIRALGCPVLAGNCEIQLALDADDCGCGFDAGSECSILSRGWYAHAQQHTAAKDKKWMGKLPDRILFTQAGLRYAIVHGAASDVAKFIWPVTPDAEITDELTLLERQVGPVGRVIAGHTGIPMHKVIGNHHWHNTGAIGMPPHDGNPNGCYSLLSNGKITQHRLQYDPTQTIEAMQNAGLTQGYHLSLTTGYMPSEDTFPPEMRRA